MNKNLLAIILKVLSVIFVTNKGDISSILDNGFVEKLGAKNIYSLEGGIQAYLNFEKN